jgi:hypothetical protein
MSHSSGNFVAQSAQDVYFGTPGGIATIHKSNEEVSYITKVEGLSDISVQTLAWSTKQNRLIIGYQNSNLDLYDPAKNEIINLPDILRNQRILGDRFIYRINVPPGSDQAYLACGFGIVELNLAKNEFGFTAFTGIPVYEVVLYKNQLIAATENGIYAIPYDKSKFNMSDFGQWTWISTFGTSPYQSLAVFNNLLYLGSRDKVFYWDGELANNAVTLIQGLPDHQIQYLSAGADQVLAGYYCKNNCDGRLYMIDKSNKVQLLDASCVPRPLFGIVDEKGKGWFADRFQAFRSNNKITDPCSFKYFNTPLSPYSTDIALYMDRVYIASGGIDASYSYLFRGDGFFSLVDGIWRFYNRGNQIDIQKADLVDMYKMMVDPASGTLFIGTFWGGLIQCNMNDPAKPVIKVWDKSNSSLQGATGDIARTRVGGLTYDRKGNLWMTNYLAEKPISVFKKDGTWKNFSSTSNNTLLACATDSAGYIWMAAIGLGLMVLDPGPNIDITTDDRYKIFTPSNSVLQSNIVNAIATDQDGSVWVGTNNGVVVIECGESVFDAACVVSKRIIVQQDLGGNLLDKADVQCIAIDGANRKWFGTRSGIQVLSASGEQLVYNYTIENSPLFDNLITVLRYEPNTGEMFIGTGSGVQSIRTDATSGSRNNEYGDIYAFPNPVRPEYSGPIAIQGMRKNSNVKITDFNGQIVHQGKSNGGTFIWDGQDLNGNRVASGIYVAWISAGNGFDQPDTKLVKIAVVR